MGHCCRSMGCLGTRNIATRDAQCMHGWCLPRCPTPPTLWHWRTSTGETQTQLLEAGVLDRLLRLVHPDEPAAALVLALDTLRALGDSDEHCQVRCWWKKRGERGTQMLLCMVWRGIAWHVVAVTEHCFVSRTPLHMPNTPLHSTRTGAPHNSAHHSAGCSGPRRRQPRRIDLCRAAPAAARPPPTAQDQPTMPPAGRRAVAACCHAGAHSSGWVPCSGCVGDGGVGCAGGCMPGGVDGGGGDSGAGAGGGRGG